MSMAETTEHSSAPSDLGQRFFLLGVFVVMVVDAVTTVVNIGHWFAWTSCLLGIVSCLVTLFLANRLYVGDKVALSLTRLWVVLQLAVIVCAVAISLSPGAEDSSFGRHVGVNALWEGYLKLAAYLLLAGLLFVPGITLDYLSIKRGETPAAPAVRAVAPLAAPTPIELAADQIKALEGLGAAMSMASSALLAAGVFLLLTGILTVAKTPAAGCWSILGGGNLAILGGTLRGTSAALRKLLGANPRDLGLALKFFGVCKDYVVAFVELVIGMVFWLLLILPN